jgi:phosphomannomutase
VRLTKIGSPYVVAALDELLAGGRFQRIVGWEANGGFLTASELRLGRRVLPPLPTRDAVLPILANLLASAELRVSLSQLWDRLPARFGCAGLIDNFPVENSRAILDRLTPPSAAVDVQFVGDQAKGLSVQASDAWKESKRALGTCFPSELGFAEIVRMNVIDGLRIFFANGDVAHIRPSGNAPQLRCYSNSSSQSRADQIVELAVREPDGILRQLERKFA